MDKQPMLWEGDPHETPPPPDSPVPSDRRPADPEAAEPTTRPEPPQLNTTGHIAAMLGVPVHRIRWVLATRPDIRPTAYAAQARLFNSAAVARIRHELTAIDARRCREPGKDAESWGEPE